MRYLFGLLIASHALIHLMGFAKALNWGKATGITKEIGRPAGVLWLLATLVLIFTVIIYLLRKDWWWMPAVAGVLLSQILIFSAWKDAGFGSLVNVLILVIAFTNAAASFFTQQYRRDVTAAWHRTKGIKLVPLSEADMAHLPAPVQRYLRYAGCPNKPKVVQAQFRFSGRMREKGKPFFAFNSEQFNTFDEPARLFFMQARINGLPTAGYHRYAHQHASMDIRLLSMIPVVRSNGNELDQAETVTLFNDMCVLAPATLIDRRIRWERLNNFEAKGYFTNGDITISAVLHFNKTGQLVNFTSNDRYALTKGKLQRYPFSTPVRDYRNFGGYRIAAKGRAVWHMPEGAFVYGEFLLHDVRYNATPNR